VSGAFVVFGSLKFFKFSYCTFEEGHRKSLTREHSDLINIVEVAIAFTFETSPQICYKDLSSLVETDCTTIEPVPVIEAGKIVD